jgi:hypothetical protein
MDQKIVLSNGLPVEIKRIGARSQARIFDIIRKIIDSGDFKRQFEQLSTIGTDVTAGISVAAGLVGEIIGKNYLETCEIIKIVSTLNDEQLADDAENPLAIDDFLEVIARAYYVNDFARLAERLKNGLMPFGETDGILNPEATAKVSKLFSSTNSEALTDGAEAKLNR